MKIPVNKRHESMREEYEQWLIHHEADILYEEWLEMVLVSHMEEYNRVTEKVIDYLVKFRDELPNKHWEFISNVAIVPLAKLKERNEGLLD